jgi:hypothetical protein
MNEAPINFAPAVAQANRSLRKNGHRIPDPNICRFGAAESGRRDIGEEDNLFVG